MHRVEWTRLRWRMRGAWQWPVFAGATIAEAVLLNELPVWGDGAGGFAPGLLLAGCLNLIVVAVAAPVAALLLRRRRPDLPKAIARDYCGTALLGVLLAVLVTGGLSHRSVLADDRHDRALARLAVARYVERQQPAYRRGLALLDTVRVEPDMYRSCVPGSDPKRPLCLFVRTSQSPPGVTRDPDRVPNTAYRELGGFE
jgi:hypothetical protein